MHRLKVTNTLTKQKELFEPLSGKLVKLYACGVTPYSASHIGHGRSFVNVDTIVRLLRFLGYDVTYVRNITDIDDKLLKKAEEQGDINLYKDIANTFIASTEKELEKLNCITPDAEPRVTENIEKIIQFISELIEKKHAYVAGNDVYFDVMSFADYGKLSGRNVEDMIAGTRFEVEKNKRASGPVAIIILTIIGVALSSKKVRGGIGMHLGVGIGLTFSYILLMQVSTVFSTFGNLSPVIASWIPNIIFTFIAIYLLKKAPK